MILNLQAKLIVNILVGTEYAETKIDFETEKDMTQETIGQTIQNLFVEGLKRGFALHHLMLPWFLSSCYTPKDLRYARNINRLKSCF